MAIMLSYSQIKSKWFLFFFLAITAYNYWNISNLTL